MLNPTGRLSVLARERRARLIWIRLSIRLLSRWLLSVGLLGLLPVRLLRRLAIWLVRVLRGLCHGRSFTWDCSRITR